MTKEEALKILRKDSLSNLVYRYSSEELQDAIDTIVSQPSLPSDLDQAAEEYIKFKPRYDIQQELEEGEDPTEIDCFTIDAAIDSFKDGAEWMAEQGVSMLGKVGIYGVDVESITKELREAGFNLGEEIILQIRKKQ